MKSFAFRAVILPASCGYSAQPGIGLSYGFLVPRRFFAILPGFLFWKEVTDKCPPRTGAGEQHLGTKL